MGCAPSKDGHTGFEYSSLGYHGNTLQSNNNKDPSDEHQNRKILSSKGQTESNTKHETPPTSFDVLLPQKNSSPSRASTLPPTESALSSIETASDLRESTSLPKEATPTDQETTFSKDSYSNSSPSRTPLPPLRVTTGFPKQTIPPAIEPILYSRSSEHGPNESTPLFRETTFPSRESTSIPKELQSQEQSSRDLALLSQKQTPKPSQPHEISSLSGDSIPPPLGSQIREQTQYSIYSSSTKESDCDSIQLSKDPTNCKPMPNSKDPTPSPKLQRVSFCEQNEPTEASGDYEFPHESKASKMSSPSMESTTNTMEQRQPNNELTTLLTSESTPLLTREITTPPQSQISESRPLLTSQSTPLLTHEVTSTSMESTSHTTEKTSPPDCEPTPPPPSSEPTQPLTSEPTQLLTCQSTPLLTREVTSPFMKFTTDTPVQIPQPTSETTQPPPTSEPSQPLTSEPTPPLTNQPTPLLTREVTSPFMESTTDTPIQTPQPTSEPTPQLTDHN